jgi:hypothetical protein
MAAKLTRLTHKIAIQLHLVAESCTICSSRSRRPVQKLLNTPSYLPFPECVNDFIHVRRVICHHRMVRHQVADGGKAFRHWRVAANILNKQSRTADKE